VALHWHPNGWPRMTLNGHFAFKSGPSSASNRLAFSLSEKTSLCGNLQSYAYTGWVKKSRPATTFNDIFAWAESFCIKFCTFIGNIYPHTCTDFRSFILTFSEMALILLRAPTNFTVSSFDCSAVSLLWKMQSTRLTKMMLLFSSSNV